MYRVYTIEGGKATPGAKIEKVILAGACVRIDALCVGERGRGRKHDFIPVVCSEESKRLEFARIGETRAGKTKFFEAASATTDDAVILALRTYIGYRGGNDHTGDRLPSDGECKELRFAPFPGRVLAKGVIAQGDAGRMGSGDQLIVLMPKDVVFRTAYSGRLYGGPSAHYYVWDGKNLVAATWEERCAADLF